MALALVGFTISACGIKGPLVRPSDIPQYEREHRHTKELYTPDIQPQGRP